MKKLVLAASAFTLLTTAATAQIVVNDNFNRPDGSLIGTAPTPGPGGVWVNHSGTSGDLLISGGQALVQHGVPSEDAHTFFGNQSVGVVTAVFDITVNDDTIIGGGDYEYFAHFMQEGTFNFVSRLDIVAPNASGDYTLGIATFSGTAETIFPVDFSYNTPVSVALSFDFGSGLASVKVGGTTISSTTAGLGEALDSFSLRQSDSSNNESILVDNLVITSVVPEPTTFALGGLGLLALMFARRRA